MQKPFTLLLLFCSIGLYAITPPLKRAHNQQSKQADQPTFSCSMPAYLLQGSPTDAYSVNLSTGETTLVKNNLIGPGIGGRQIQAVGYNVLDNYLWGYRTGTDQLVRIGGDWSVQFFTISGLTIAGYDVGDIDANGIMYLSTGNSTIKRIDLNSSSPTYLQALSDLTSTGTTIADWTVNVVDGNIYAINQSSLLLRYNTTTGVRTTLGVVQWSVTTGTGFGAAYSDSEGNVYVQDNQGGKIFKIDKPHLLPASTNAQIAGNLFANTGMTTSSNDGTRCMNAPPPCQAPTRPDGFVTSPNCVTLTGSLSLTLPAGSDIQYNLNAGTYQTSPQFAGLSPGSYTVTARNGLTGCVSGATTFTVAAIPAAPSAPTTSVIQPTCLVSAGTITVNTPTSGVVYSFDNGASYQSGNAKNGLAAGVYQLKVRSLASGCESGPVSVTVNAAPEVPANPTASVLLPTCLVSTGTITVNTPTSGVVYSFDNGVSYQSGNAKSGLASGVYLFKVRSAASGCESGPVSATVNAAPEVPAAPTASVTHPTCLVSTGTITVNTPSSGVTYSFDNGASYQSGNAKSGLAAGVYQLKVRSLASGCESGPVSVTVKAAPEVPAAPTASVTHPNCTVQTGTIMINTPISGVAYSFDNGVTYQSGNAKSGLVSGVYRLNVRSVASGCESGPVSVTVNAALEVPAAPTASVTHPTCLVSTGTITVNTPSSGVTYSFDNGASYQSGNAKSGLASGVYRLKVRSTVSGCESGPVSVTVNAAPEVPAAPTASVTHPTCLVSTGMITVSSPAAGVVYSFDNGVSYQSGSAKSGLASGVYQLRVRSTASGCESGPVSVTVNAAPEVPAAPTASVTHPTCLVSTGTITVNTPSGGVVYSFDNGASYQSGNVKSGLASGVYRLKVRSAASGCESAPVSVTVNAAPEVPAAPTASVTHPNCTVQTGTIMINTPISGVAYSFDNGVTYQSGNAKSGLVSGVYRLNVRSAASGCESGLVSVTVNAAPEVPAAPTASVTHPTCLVSTGTITVNTPSSGVTYSFDNGASYQSGNAKSGLASGVYRLKVRSAASGCESVPVSVTVNAAPEVPAAPTASVVQPTCLVSAGTITVNTPSGGVVYSFDNGASYQSGNVKSGLASGVYRLKVRSAASGCESAPVSVTVNAAPEVPAAPTASVTHPTCLVSTGTITVNTPSSGVVYSFDNGASYQSGNAKSGFASGVYRLKVRSTVSGCESGLVSVTVNAAPEVPAAPTASVTHPTCLVSTGTITVNTPFSGVAYSFDNGASYQSGNAKSGFASGVYRLKVRSAASGCESAPVSVTVNAAPEVPAAPTASMVQPTCLVSTGTITVSSPAAGVAYSFDNGASYQSGNAKNGLAAGVYQLKVRSLASGCESGPVSVTVNAAPEVPVKPTASVVQPTCLVSIGTITVSSPATGMVYSFDNGVSYQSGSAKSGLASGVYQLRVRSTASGCESGPVSVTVNAAPEVPANPTASVVQPTCLVSTGTITVSSPAAGVVYSFDNGVSYQSGSAKSGLASGVYQLRVRSAASGCESAPVSVTVNAAPEVPAAPTASVTHPNCTVQTGTITVSSPAAGVAYSFDNGASYQSGNAKSGFASGVYRLKVRSTASGCESAPVSVTVNAAPEVPAAPMASVVQPTCLTLTGIVEITPSLTNLWYSFNGGVDFQESPGKTAVLPGTKLTVLTKDKESGCLSAALSVTISDLANCPPVAHPNAGTVLLGSSLTGNLLADDHDPEGGRLRISQIVLNGSPYLLNSGEPVSLTIPGIGTLTIGENGAFSFLPAPKFTGPVPVIDYVVSDDAGATGMSTLGLFVTKMDLQVIAPVYDCISGELTIQITGGDGTSLEWHAVGLTDWTTNLSVTVPQELRNDPKTIPLHVRQSGYTATYAFDLVAACGDCSPGPNKPLRLKTPVLNCKESTVCVATCGGDGSAVHYKIDNLSEWSTEACVMAGDDLVHRDPKILFIRVRQGTQEQVFEYNLPLISAACPDSTRPWNQRIPVAPPPPSTTTIIPGSPTGNTGQPLALLEPLYSCATGVITFRYQGGDGQPAEFMAVGITGWTTQSIHHVEEALRLEQPPVLIYARQGSSLVSYLFDLKGYCQKATVPLPPPATTGAQPASPVSLTLLPPLYDCQTGNLRFQIAGGDNSLVEFMAVGITGWTIRAEHILDAVIRESKETVRIFARQQGIVSSLLWNPAQACPFGGRLAPTVSGLQVLLLDNPVLTDRATLRLTGLMASKTVTVLCYDSQGRFVSSTIQESVAEPVSISVKLGQMAGVYIISILVDGHQAQVKAVKP